MVEPAPEDLAPTLTYLINEQALNSKKTSRVTLFTVYVVPNKRDQVEKSKKLVNEHL